MPRTLPVVSRRVRRSFPIILLVLLLSAAWPALAQELPADAIPCSDTPRDVPACPVGLPLAPGTFIATPLIDGTGQSYGDQDANKVSLYGSYGNNLTTGAARTHYTQGTTLATQVTPLCHDGNPGPCGANQGTPTIVFLFIGFSNCDIEICGGNSDIWDGQGDDSPQTFNHHLPGQPCATPCPNLHNPDPNRPYAWNQVKGGTGNVGDDGKTQNSFLYQVYSPQTPLVGSHVVIFSGALGGQTLDHWDPTSLGYYWSHNNCDYGDTHNPECNYDRVHTALVTNGYSDLQVQAVFIKTADANPTCDLKYTYCSPTMLPDAYVSEKYLGNILRYLKCCTLDSHGVSTGQQRYPNLKQVFVTSRTYGGYASGAHGCLMPEPFAYEEGFAVQRLIVAQINRTADNYTGSVRYPEDTPWVDWGPYLWANGPMRSQGSGLNWCDSTTTGDLRCSGDPGDFRYGDLTPGYENFWGDHTHPTANGAEKVATRLVKFIQGSLGGPQQFISNWVTPWMQK